VTGFERIELEGEAYERGRQYGAQAAAAIRQNVDDYVEFIRLNAGLEREAALEAARAFAPIVEAHAPDLLVEMRGIADGAGCELADILLINARTELMAKANECTSLAACREVTSRGQVLLGQNWDWYVAIQPEPVLLQIRQPDKPEILTLAEAGQVAKIGLNSAGLGMCLNFLEHTDRGQGLPVHLIARQVLGCEALGEAIHAACSVPRGAAVNMLLAHAEGEALDLEMTASDVDFLYADAGWLVHANHFESLRLRAGDTGVTGSLSTLARAARARRLLAAAHGTVSLDSFLTILRDHAYGPYAICRHPDPRASRFEQTATRASVIMDLTAKTMYLAAGQPCRHEFEPLTFAA
jgi:isopenicillin-N N-acyltransferase-like protein